MYFLTSSLKGRALEYIASIPVTADNFKTAWQALIKRFENKRRLLKSNLSTLLNLSALSKESACDLSSLYDQVDFALAAFTNLNRTGAVMERYARAHRCREVRSEYA